MSRNHKHTELKEEVFKRDNNICVKCGHQGKKGYYNVYGGMYIDLIADHIMPIKLGGAEFDIDNMQTLCIGCNKEKNAKDQSEIAKSKRRQNKATDPSQQTL